MAGGAPFQLITHPASPSSDGLPEAAKVSGVRQGVVV